MGCWKTEKRLVFIRGTFDEIDIVVWPHDVVNSEEILEPYDS